MSTVSLVLIIIAAVLLIATLALYFFGKRMQDKQAQTDEQIQRMAQPVSMLIIDKQKIRMKKSGLPEAVIASTPWYARRAKVPIVKAKVGPQITTLICDMTVYNELPTKKEVKAMVSGIYISSFKNLHGKTVVPQKKGFMQRMMRLARQQ